MRKPTAALVATLALASPAGAAAKVRAPDGDYAGPRNLVMQISGKNIEIVAFDFPCRQAPKAHGRTSLNDIALEKTHRGYKFSTRVRGIVTYSDEHADQNGTISISGQFGRKGKSVRGRFQASTPRCGPTGKLNWSAERSPAGSR
jgi:hypothetical protein